MDVIINLLIWAHFVAFVAGGSNTVVGPVIGTRLRGAAPDARAGYYSVMDALSQVGKVSMVVLLVTGPTILFLRYGGIGGANSWFWAKMVLIAVMLFAIIFGGINEKRSRGGDVAAGKRAAIAHQISGLAFAGVLLSAVFAFN